MLEVEEIHRNGMKDRNHQKSNKDFASTKVKCPGAHKELNIYRLAYLVTLCRYLLSIFKAIKSNQLISNVVAATDTNRCEWKSSLTWISWLLPLPRRSIDLGASVDIIAIRDDKKLLILYLLPFKFYVGLRRRSWSLPGSPSRQL